MATSSELALGQDTLVLRACFLPHQVFMNHLGVLGTLRVCPSWAVTWIVCIFWSPAPASSH